MGALVGAEAARRDNFPEVRVVCFGGKGSAGAEEDREELAVLVFNRVVQGRASRTISRVNRGTGRVCGPSCCTCPTYSAAAGRLIKSRLVAASPPFDDSGSGAEMRSGLRAIKTTPQIAVPTRT